MRRLSAHLIWNTELPKFANRFRIANRLWYRWPLKVHYDAVNDCVIVDDGKTHIAIVRPRRLRLYKNGIEKRLEAVASSYMLEDIPFLKDDLVIDCGANIGEIGLFLHKKFLGKFVMIEPDQKEIHALKINMAEANAKFYEGGLWHEDGTLTFYSENDTGDSSLISGTADASGTGSVPVSRLDALLDRLDLAGHPIRLLKLEAEGAEPEVLRGAEQTLRHVEFIAADLGPERGPAGESTLPVCTNYLLSRGFQMERFDYRRCSALFRKLGNL